MLEKNQIKKYDQSLMHEAYDLWPKMALDNYSRTINTDIEFQDIDHIAFAGMGGSGAAGEILRGVLSKSNYHTTVIKGYTLPHTVDSNTLLIVTSVSGNSEEPLTILAQIKKTKPQVVAISDGGKMQEFCKKNNTPHIAIKQVNSPRASLPIILYSILSFLGSNFKIRTDDVTESIKLLEETAKKINSDNLSDQNPSLSLGNWINKIPVIYYPYGLYAAALRFKNSLQENCKSNAMTEDVVEACHNNIVSWERPAPVQPILIRGVGDYPKTKERWEILKEYFRTNNIEFREVFSEKGSILSKLINLIYILDYATIYNAVLNQIDPTPIKSIDFIKSKL
jgi:glucose/mannose-6-phosphate isomerase